MEYFGDRRTLPSRYIIPSFRCASVSPLSAARRTQAMPRAGARVVPLPARKPMPM